MKTKSDIRTYILMQRRYIEASLRRQKSQKVCQQLESTLVPLPGLIAVYAAMEGELSLDLFITATYRKGVQLCFPCMVRTASARMENGANWEADSASPTHDARPSPARMEFRVVSPQDYTGGQAAFVAHPLQSFAPDAPALEPFAVVDPTRIGAVVVPLVAFDAHGGRLGYGGGNYDRFLPRLAPGTRIIGVAFTEQEVDHIPCENHDIALPELLFA
ncbi:MAG: 5-formyltetrahydrofolate cyclo-ligase [Raoultibacter sp.]